MYFMGLNIGKLFYIWDSYYANGWYIKTSTASSSHVVCLNDPSIDTISFLASCKVIKV